MTRELSGIDLPSGISAPAPIKAVAPDRGSVQDHRADADQGIVADRAAVQHDHVPDGHTVADDQRKAEVGVQDAAVLNVRPLAHGDRLVVAAQHAVPPDAGIAPEADLAYEHGGRRDPALLAGRADAVITEGVTHEGPPASVTGILA
jgi:hypothetical protein